MSTTAQTQASRANGARSQGPVTQAGKAASAANSRKHGLCSKEFVLHSAEEQKQFDAHLEELCFIHQANHQVEREACRHLAVAMWRRRVCDNLEREVMQGIGEGRVCAQTGGDGLPGLAAVSRYRARIARDMKEAKTELAELKLLRAKAFQAQIDKAKEFAQGTILESLKSELGETGFGLFREAVAPLPKPEQTNPAKLEQAKANNPTSLRQKAKLARKQNRKRK